MPGLGSRLAAEKLLFVAATLDAANKLAREVAKRKRAAFEHTLLACVEPSEAASLIRRLGLERCLSRRGNASWKRRGGLQFRSRFGKKGVETMSVAFTREESAETAAEVELPDRPISPYANLVTATGLEALADLGAEYRATYDAAHQIEDATRTWPRDRARLSRNKIFR
jgi:hypothetical protein